MFSGWNWTEKPHTTEFTVQDNSSGTKGQVLAFLAYIAGNSRNVSLKIPGFGLQIVRNIKFWSR